MIPRLAVLGAALVASSSAAVAAGTAAEAGGPAYFPADYTQARIICDPMRPDRREPALAASQAAYYARYLMAAQEVPLASEGKRVPGAAPEVIRFTWLRSLHRPVTVRIDLRGKAAHLVARQLSGRAGHDPGTIAETATRDLGAAEVQQLRSLLKASDLDSLPPKQCDDRVTMEGARWLFEHAGPKSDYRLVDRAGPRSGPLHALGLFMLGLTGWGPETMD